MPRVKQERLDGWAGQLMASGLADLAPQLGVPLAAVFDDLAEMAFQGAEALERARGRRVMGGAIKCRCPEADCHCGKGDT